ncbi:MAG: hypothetical protein R3C68_14445 [Myxococcota bacterium]
MSLHGYLGHRPSFKQELPIEADIAGDRVLEIALQKHLQTQGHDLAAA